MDLKLANQLLKNYKCTCIILKNDKVIYKSTCIGVKPLLAFLNKHIPLKEDDKLILIDKIVGRASLLLAVKCKINKIFTHIISSEALSAADYYNIEWESDNIVPHIKNRNGDGKCPIESSVTNTIELDEALANIESAVATLMERE